MNAGSAGFALKRRATIMTIVVRDTSGARSRSRVVQLARRGEAFVAPLHGEREKQWKRRFSRCFPSAGARGHEVWMTQRIGRLL